MSESRRLRYWGKDRIDFGFGWIPVRQVYRFPKASLRSGSECRSGKRESPEGGLVWGRADLGGYVKMMLTEQHSGVDAAG